MSTPQRTVDGNLLRSTHSPPIHIEVDRAFTYVGSVSFILYNLAHAEQHHFVVADAARRVERLLWFQFEGYLENNSRTYNYPPTSTVLLGGYEFLDDSSLGNIDAAVAQRPDSDTAHAVRLLRQHGYSMRSGEILSKRLVWLDSAKRHELMIIYGEEPGLSGLRVADLEQDGERPTGWPAIVQDLHRRALASFRAMAE